MKKIVCVFICAAAIFSMCSCAPIRIAVYNPVIDTDYWQNDIPKTIPKFNYGIIDKDMSCRIPDEDSVSYMLSYIIVTKKDVGEYEKTLENAGFIVSVYSDADRYSVMGITKDARSNAFTQDEPIRYPSVVADLTPSNGTCLVTITVYNPEKASHTPEITGYSH